MGIDAKSRASKGQQSGCRFSVSARGMGRDRLGYSNKTVLFSM